jgi:hypothetical protein
MLLTERFADSIPLVVSCFDRMVLTGTLVDFGHAKVATQELNRRHIRIFDFPAFANTVREALRAHAEAVAAAHGRPIEFVRSTKVRKETLIQSILAERGTAPGLVHILSVMEECVSFRPWHDKATHRTYLQPDSGKCPHYYVYFIDAELWPLLSARADVGALPGAVLLQWPQLARSATHEARHRLHPRRHRVRPHR